jgi:proline dehydrogenase
VLGRAVLWVADRPGVQRLVTRGRLARPKVERFVAGDHLEDAVRAIARLNEKGIGGILDLLGEGVRDPAGANQAAEEYLRSIQAARKAGIDTTISVKPTQLGLAFDRWACLGHLRALASEARAAGMTLEIDMEQTSYVTDTLAVFRALRQEGHQRVRLAIQAYLHRTQADLDAMRDLAPRVRLVKGAYKEPPDLAIQAKPEIDQRYRELAGWLFDHGTDPGIATHDERLIEHACALARERGLTRRSFEVQMLYGVRRDLQEELAARGYRVRTYVPFGSHWYPYLSRRIAERPANLFFVLRAALSG